ncbi:MAG: C-terminal helicase domain-containing protein, partial [Thermoanaerobaculia bacterium]
LTGNGARVLGGRISRVEAIGRFAPNASGRAPPRAAEAVTLLLTTDILSEGVNLQDAGVVVHLDLPWTPARMEQRVGRVARMGSRHERVFSYVMRPPASADMLIRTESILRNKMASAGIVTDDLQSILPGELGEQRAGNLPRVVEELRSVLEQWKCDAPEKSCDKLVASAITAPINGFLALCRSNGQYRIFVSDVQGVTDEPSRVLAMMRCAGGEETALDAGDLANAVRLMTRHLAAIRAVGFAHLPSHPRQLAQRIALKRIAQISNNARPHERSYIVPAVERARATILGQLGAGQETRLAALSAARMPDRDWLRDVTALSRAPSANVNADVLIAVIICCTSVLSKRDSCRKTLPSTV